MKGFIFKHRVGIAMFFFALAIGATVWSTFARISVHNKSVNTQETTEEVLKTVINVMEANCYSEQGLRNQYKIRGEDVKKTAQAVSLLVNSAIELLGPEPSKAKKSFNEANAQLGLIEQSVQILPVPDCEHLGEQLREKLPE